MNRYNQIYSFLMSVHTDLALSTIAHLSLVAEATGLLNKATPCCLNMETLGICTTTSPEWDQLRRQGRGVTGSPSPGEPRSRCEWDV